MNKTDIFIHFSLGTNGIRKSKIASKLFPESRYQSDKNISFDDMYKCTTVNIEILACIISPFSKKINCFAERSWIRKNGHNIQA